MRWRDDVFEVTIRLSRRDMRLLRELAEFNEMSDVQMAQRLVQVGIGQNLRMGVIEDVCEGCYYD